MKLQHLFGVKIEAYILYVALTFKLNSKACDENIKNASLGNFFKHREMQYEVPNTGLHFRMRNMH